VISRDHTFLRTQTKQKGKEGSRVVKRHHQQFVLYKFNASIIVRGGLLGCTFDSVHAADPKPKSVRGDHRRATSPDLHLHPQRLSSHTPRFLSYSQLHHHPLVQVDPFLFHSTNFSCNCGIKSFILGFNLRDDSMICCVVLVHGSFLLIIISIGFLIRAQSFYFSLIYNYGINSLMNYIVYYT
jgi:hypothetical protein